VCQFNLDQIPWVITPSEVLLLNTIRNRYTGNLETKISRTLPISVFTV
jgi:hypothetical protein